MTHAPNETKPQNADTPQSSGLMRSGLVVAVMTMLSRVMGLVRDVLFARFIGAGGDADAFFLAFKIPNFLRRLFAEGAFAQAFVPVLSEYRNNGSKQAVQLFVNNIAGCLGVSLIAITVLAVVAAPAFTAIWGAGLLYSGGMDKFWLTSDLLRLTFPYLLFISLTGFAGAILNSYDRFAVPAFTPVLLNMCLIIAAVFATPYFETPVFALAWGVLIAGVLQFVFQLPFLVHLGLLPRPRVNWQDPAVKKVLLLMAPAMFGVSVSQINLMLDTVIATFIPNDGSISWLYYSDRLTELPLGVFGVGIATIILPTLSRQFSGQSDKGYTHTLNWALQMVLLIALPAALALIILAKPLLFTLFQYDKTTVFDVQMAALSMQAYALGLVAFMLIKILASAYFSRQDTKTPVKIGIIAMVVNMALNLLFVIPLHVFWQVGHVGLALATSCSATLNAWLLFRGLRKTGVFHAEKGWGMFGVRVTAGCAFMLCGLIFVMQYQSSFVDLNWIDRVTEVVLAVFIGMVCYIFGMMVCGMRLRHFKHLAH